MDELGLVRGTRLNSRTDEIDVQLQAALDQSESRGLVTADEVDNLLVSDFIIRVQKAIDRQYVYAVIEVSHTISDQDIDQARGRARTLAAATGEETVAVVIGGAIQPQQQQYAEATGVQVAIPTIFRAESQGEDND